MRRRGITVRELLIVVALIAALAAALFPVYGRARQKQLNSRLLRAAWEGNDDVVARSLAQGADPNTTGEDGVTPLHEAAREGHYTSVALLIEAGANVQTKNVYGVTPLHQAAYMGHVAIVRSLIEAGADVNAREREGRTALHLAIQQQDKDVMAVLKKHGAKQ
jgi:cytohesin